MSGGKFGNDKFDVNDKFKREGVISESRNDIIDEAIEKIRDCELVEPNVKRIRLHEAIGALLELKVPAAVVGEFVEPNIDPLFIIDTINSEIKHLSIPPVPIDDPGMLAEETDGINLPSETTFEKVNGWIHGADVHFEEVQALCLGMATELDTLRERLKCSDKEIKRLEIDNKDWADEFQV